MQKCPLTQKYNNRRLWGISWQNNYGYEKIMLNKCCLIDVYIIIICAVSKRETGKFTV